MMSRQLSLESYFKTKGSTPKSSQSLDCKNMSDKKVKRRSLSLIKHCKSPKKSEENKAVDSIINLCSDDEDVFDSPKLCTPKEYIVCTPTVNLSQGSTGSNDTLIYSVSPETPKKTKQNLQTPQKTHQSLRTPQKTPQSSSNPQSSKLKSTPSPQKFFSPTKNRTVVKRSPSKVKRSLSMEMAGLAELAEDETFANACSGMDDKSE